MPKVIHTNIKRKLIYTFASIPILSNFISAIPTFAISASVSEEFNFTVNVQSIPTLALQIGSSSDNLNPSGTGLNLDIAPKYATNSLKTEPLHVYVYTSSDNGYQLSMATNTTSLVGDFTLTNGTRPAINSLANTTTGITYEEFNSYNNESVINKWGYTLTKTNLTSSTTSAVGKFLGIKDVAAEEGGMSDTNNYMPLNAYNHESGESTSESETIIDFGVNINTKQPAGPYKTTITFLAIANVPNPVCDAYTICYDSNGVLSDSKMGDEPVASTTENNVTTYQDTTLWASNFKNPSGVNGYGFAGWNTKADGTGTNYGPNETLTVAQLNTIANNNLASEGAILYANWIPAEKNCTMQNFIDTPECINKIETSTVIALRDTRDDNVYAVAKLADGKYWMVENLRLDSTPELNSNNTNVPSNWGGMTNTIDQSTGDIVSGPSNHLTASSTTGDAEAYWCAVQNSANCYNQSRLNSANTTNPVNNLTNSTLSNVYSYGNYYNWYSVTAGSGTYETVNNNGNIVNASRNIDTSYSICPINWRLPTGGGSDKANVATSSDFWGLGVSIIGTGPNISNNTSSYYDSISASKAFRTYPNNFVFSGVQSGSTNINHGKQGFYWSSTNLSFRLAYYLSLFANSVYPGTNNVSKHFGFSARCVTGS